MKYKNAIATGLTLLALTGCKGEKDKETVLESYVSYPGIPKNVMVIPSHYDLFSSITIDLGDGYHVTGTAEAVGSKHILMNASSAVQAEINDGDNEPIVLSGYIPSDQEGKSSVYQRIEGFHVTQVQVEGRIYTIR